MILAYKTYILSIFDYCSPIWSPNTIVDNISRIQSVQRMFTKKLPTFSNLSFSEPLLKADMISLELRHVHADLIVYFKIIQGLLNINMTDFIYYEYNTITSGHPWRLRALKPQLDSSRHFFAYPVVNV